MTRRRHKAPKAPSITRRQKAALITHLSWWWTHQQELAQHLPWSSRTVCQRLRELEAQGLVERSPSAPSLWRLVGPSERLAQRLGPGLRGELGPSQEARAWSMLLTIRMPDGGGTVGQHLARSLADAIACGGH